MGSVFKSETILTYMCNFFNHIWLLLAYTISFFAYLSTLDYTSTTYVQGTATTVSANLSEIIANLFVVNEYLFIWSPELTSLCVYCTKKCGEQIYGIELCCASRKYFICTSDLAFNMRPVLVFSLDIQSKECPCRCWRQPATHQWTCVCMNIGQKCKWPLFCNIWQAAETNGLKWYLYLLDWSLSNTLKPVVCEDGLARKWKWWRPERIKAQR